MATTAETILEQHEIKTCSTRKGDKISWVCMCICKHELPWEQVARQRAFRLHLIQVALEHSAQVQLDKEHWL